MLRIDFEKLVESKQEADKLERLNKGDDYAKPHEDVLDNFHEVARRLEGAAPDALTTWAVYFEKHVIAVERYIRDRKTSSEPIGGRLKDLRNYCYLGEALIEEQEAGERAYDQLMLDLQKADAGPQDVVAPEATGGLFSKLLGRR